MSEIVRMMGERKGQVLYAIYWLYHIADRYSPISRLFLRLCCPAVVPILTSLNPSSSLLDSELFSFPSKVRFMQFEISGS